MSKIKRALISVSDKNGILDFAKDLIGLGIEIISTGGTYSALYDSGIKVKDISSVTDFPEILDGRVKTLHPNVHGGLLGKRNNDGHAKVMEEHGIQNIDLLVVNLYPFEETILKKSDYETCIENIDIGGPAMIRAAAKNHSHVGVVVDPDDYTFIINELKDGQGSLKKKTLKELALKAYARTAAYDSTIANWMSEELDQPLGKFHSLGGVEQQNLRYGENPHQKAKFYNDGSNRKGLITSIQLQGKELSYNNINDTNAAFELVSEFNPDEDFAAAIIKHANPCGVATGKTLLEAYSKALRCDSVSAFGGIIALNKKLDGATAEKISEIFTEVIIAPEISEEAKAVLANKKNLRVLITGGLADPNLPGVVMRSVSGGFLAQTKDNIIVDKNNLKVVSSRQPSEQEMQDLLFAFKVAKHVKSNAIVYVKDGATVGIGAGQMNRLDSSRIAARKSEDAAKAEGIESPLAIGSVVASDAFFPFADGLMAAADAGVTAIIQPGGSIRDDEVIKAADDANLAMIFTGIRHFNH
jgi:phosphoribosylaminoimidazolecarboxamide formyltransferase/IMP cyclohydrolase|tara:strand:+ start:1657 stop:3237 length:1581 start_codon:yes stop_codon:yes gene_type:complete